MGDRGNIRIVEENGNEIYFYSHLTGNALPDILKAALMRGKYLWDDGSYLARIIFSEMIKDAVLDETGYGISTYRIGDEYPLISVMLGTHSVICRNGKEKTFQEYIDE